MEPGRLVPSPRCFNDGDEDVPNSKLKKAVDFSTAFCLGDWVNRSRSNVEGHFGFPQKGFQPQNRLGVNLANPRFGHPENLGNFPQP